MAWLLTTGIGLLCLGGYCLTNSDCCSIHGLLQVIGALVICGCGGAVLLLAWMIRREFKS